MHYVYQQHENTNKIPNGSIEHETRTFHSNPKEVATKSRAGLRDDDYLICIYIGHTLPIMIDIMFSNLE